MAAPLGLFQKYEVRKANGSPIDPGAIYLVLRLDAGAYVGACRSAAAVFASLLVPDNRTLAKDVFMLLAHLAMGIPFQIPTREEASRGQVPA